MAKPKPDPKGDAKKARKKTDEDLSNAHKGDNVGGSLRALGRLLGGKR